MILFIDTTSGFTRVAFGNEVLEFTAEKQSVDLPERTKELLAGRRPAAIFVVTGPGSFTGIRLGIAYAKGLAMGFKIPLFGINLFDFSNTQIAAIDSGSNDFFVRDNGEFYIAKKLPPASELLVGYDMKDAIKFIKNYFEKTPSVTNEVVPLYIRPSYVEK